MLGRLAEIKIAATDEVDFVAANGSADLGQRSEEGRKDNRRLK